MQSALTLFDFLIVLSSLHVLCMLCMLKYFRQAARLPLDTVGADYVAQGSLQSTQVVRLYASL